MAAVGTAATSSAAHGCRATRASGDLSVGTNTLTAIAFTAEDFDTDTIHDNSTNNSRLTIPTISGVTTGLWSVKASGYSNITTGTVDVALRVGGSTIIGFVRLPSNSGGISGYVGSVDWVFTAADYVECLVRTSGAGSVTFDAGSSPLFSIAFLGKVS